MGICFFKNESEFDDGLSDLSGSKYETVANI
jgi:hypothetical protein